MGTKRVDFRLPEELVTRADLAAEVTHKNRTEILIEALRQYLDEIGSNESSGEAMVEFYLDDQIEFDTLADVIGRQNAESVRASKQVPDRGEELADNLVNLYMLVVDTSAFISLAGGDVLETVTSEFEIVTTEPVVHELAETADYDVDTGPLRVTRWSW